MGVFQLRLLESATPQGLFAKPRLWEPPNFYEGLPLEVFRAFGDLIDAPLSPNEIEGAVQLLPSQNPDGSLEPGDPKGWKAFADHVSEIAFGGEASEIFVARQHRNGGGSFDDQFRALRRRGRDFFPTNRVSAVIMPLVEILDEQKARDGA